MTIEAWLGLGTILIAIGGGLLRHVVEDARYRQRLISIETRLAKLDGIHGR